HLPPSTPIPTLPDRRHANIPDQHHAAPPSQQQRKVARSYRGRGRSRAAASRAQQEEVAPPPCQFSQFAPPSPTFLLKATEEAQHLKKLIQDYIASFIKVGDKMDPNCSWMYSGWPIKRIVLFQCKWFDPTSRGTRELKQHNIIEVKHTRKYEAYDPFIIAQNVKQVYYAPYPLRRDKSDWWVVIKTKPMGRVEVENELDVAYQNEISSVHQVVDVELEMNLEHPYHILEEVNREELDMPTNMEEDEEETFKEDEWIDEEETSEDDACEWIDDEETSKEDE
ncbi:hypothetical protein AABB24_003510, partial [Solanum stoloniferum]